MIFQCELIMEKHEPHITDVFKTEKTHEDAVIELCETRTQLCSGLKRKFNIDELLIHLQVELLSQTNLF